MLAIKPSFIPEPCQIQPDFPLILVADDDEPTRKMLRQVMEREGYRVVEADNPEECIEAYKIFHPDLVLLDHMMPVMNGLTCCLQLRELPEREGTPILIITNLNDSESVEQALAAGATDYLVKPSNEYAV